MYDNGVYSDMEFPSVAMSILDESPVLSEDWHFLPRWVRSGIRAIIAGSRSDPGRMVSLHLGDPEAELLNALELGRRLDALGLLKFEQEIDGCIARAPVPDARAIKSLSRALRLPRIGGGRNWWFDVADSRRVGDFAERLLVGDLSVDERFALMSLALASVEEFVHRQGSLPEEWVALVGLLREDSSLYADLVRFWRDGGVAVFGAVADLTPHVRSLGLVV